MKDIRISEWCSVGHPDRTCDYIASRLLDRYLSADPKARVALEVQLKDEYCTIGGEVTSGLTLTPKDIADEVREALREVGYTDEYAARFGRANVAGAGEVRTTARISRQSPDIAQGVDGGGWGDQGIFWGLAVDDDAHGNLPLDYWLAREVGFRLRQSALTFPEYHLGIDVKTLVTTEDGRPRECLVAVPTEEEYAEAATPLAAGIARRALMDANAVASCALTVNGTGRYVRHGSRGDCGTTGRKLVADFYGGNSRIGGGSPWGKDPTKADVSLNILARLLALRFMRRHGLHEVRCGIACCIGRDEVGIRYYDEHDALLRSDRRVVRHDWLIDALGLAEPRWAARCANGLFGHEGEAAMEEAVDGLLD